MHIWVSRRPSPAGDAMMTTPGTSLQGRTLLSSGGTSTAESPAVPRKFLRGVVVAGCVISSTLAPVSWADAAALSSDIVESRTMPAVPAQAASPETGSADAPRVLRRVQRTSGLGLGDVARALGVSRRSVHNWLAGARISRVHLVRLLEFDRVLDVLSLGTPEATRTRLLQPRANGRSVLDELELAARSARRVPISTLSLGDMLEAVDDEPIVLDKVRRASTLAPRALSRGQLPKS